MPTFFSYGYKDVYRTREEIVSLINHRIDVWAASPAASGLTRDEIEADRQQRIDSIKPIEIDAECLFNKTGGMDRWSIWSDGVIRWDVGLTEVRCYNGWVKGADNVTRMVDVEVFDRDHLKPGESLWTTTPAVPDSPVSLGAEKFLSGVQGADGSNAKSYPWLGLVRDAVEGAPLTVGGDRGYYARSRVIPYTLALADGSKKNVWVFSVGYCEGYCFDVYESRSEAMKAMRPDVDPSGSTECWECGATYDEPGHVEYGNMGCDRCG